MLRLLSEMYNSTLLKVEMFRHSSEFDLSVCQVKEHISTKILKFRWKFLKVNDIWRWKQEIPLIILCTWLKMAAQASRTSKSWRPKEQSTSICVTDSLWGGTTVCVWRTADEKAPTAVPMVFKDHLTPGRADLGSKEDTVLSAPPPDNNRWELERCDGSVTR